MKFIKNTSFSLNHRFTLLGRGVSKISIFILITLFVLLQKEAISQTHSNITISTSANSGGAWSGTGTISDPYKFTPTTATSNILNTDLQTKLNANGYVLITTQISPTGTTVSAGTVIFSTAITGTSTNSSEKTFTITANSTITINTSSNLIMTTSTDAASSQANYSYKVTKLDFTSATGDIVINAPISTIPASTSFAANGAAGGNITLTAAGIINVAAAGSIQTNGQQNTNGTYHDVAGASKAWSGGYGGNIILNGTGGITIAGLIEAKSGADVLGTSGYEFTYPGSLTVNTNAITALNGQTTNTKMSVGNFIKKGTGNFQIYNVGYGGRSLANDSTYNAYDTIYSGKLILMAANALTTTSISGASVFADLVVTSPGIFELNGFSQSLGTISGNGTTTSSSGTPTLTLTYNNNKRITAGSTLFTTYSGLISGSLSINKTFTQNSNGNYQASVLLLTGNNTYTGTTTISQGIIRITNAGALGTYAAGQGTTIMNRGVLEISGGLTINEPLNIRGIGDNADAFDAASYPANTGAVKNTSGITTLLGAIVIDSTAKIGSYGAVAASDSLIINTTINTGASTNFLNIDGTRGIGITGIISGSGGLSMLGASTLKLTAANTYIGKTTVTAGSLLLGAADRISNSSDLYFNGGNFNTGGFGETLNNVYVTAAGSTLTFGSSASHILLFAGSDNSFVDNYVKIIGWTGTYASPGSNGTGGKIQFTNLQTNLQLDRFAFYSASNEYYALQINSTTPFEIVPGNNKTTFTQHTNINISTSNTTGGSWTGDGSLATPWVFTPNTDNVNIKVDDIQNKIIGANGYVTIKTNYSSGTKAGAIFINNTITATNIANTNTRVLTFQAKQYIYVNQAITLSASTNATNVVPEINFTSDSAIYINAAVTANATAISAASKVANGGAITLNATAGIVKVATTGSLESKGANNIGAGNGGDGGIISILGFKGITILGNINTNNGYSNNTAATLNLSRPGTLIVNTNNTTTTTSGGVNDGQTTRQLAIGNLVKNGAGTFPITKSVWGGSTGIGTTSYTTPIDSVNAGKLILISTNALSDSAHLVVASGATFDLNNNSETIGMIEGAGTITSAANTNVLTLSGIFTDSLSSTFSGTLGTIALTKEGIDTLVLSGDNGTSYTGVTTITNGILKVAHANALGTTASNTIVNTNGTLQIQGNGVTLAEPITISTAGFNAGGALRNTSGINYYSGAITVSGASTIVSTGTSTTGDSLVITSGLLTLNALLTVNTVMGVRIGNNGATANQVNGAGAVTKTGTDTLVMVGSNNYSGVTTVSSGVISIRNANALGAGANNTVVANGAALYIVGTGFNITEVIQIDGTGIGSNGAIWIPSTTGATTLSGAITTNTVAARINNDGTGLLTIGTAAFTNNSGITFGLKGTGNISVTSAIGGNGALIKDGNGAGMLILGGANTYAGITTISTGVLQATHGTALGNATGATSITDGAAFEINGAITIAEPITINGTGLVATPGVIRLISGSGAATLSGAITVATASRINSDAATNALTIGTGAITNTGGLTFGTSSTGNISVTSAISGVGGITKDGSGTGILILGGSNTYAGATLVSTGVIQVTANDALGSVSAGGAGASTTTVNTGAALEINGSISGIPEAITINGTGLVASPGVIRMVSGSAAATISGVVTAATASRINSDAATNALTFSTGGIVNTGGLTFGISNSGNIAVSGIISGVGTLTKDGTAAGRLVLGGANTYQGATRITGGFLQITSSDALGSQTAGTLGYSSTTISDGATLELNGAAAITVPEIINANGNGVTGTPGAIRQIHATNNATLNGAITALTGTATSINNDANALLTIGIGGITNTGGIIFRTTGTTGGINVTGVISGVGALTKDGALAGTGRLVLSAANTYQGITTVTNGVIQIKNNDALGSATAGTGTSYTTVSSPAAIEFNGASALTIPEDIRINGLGFVESIANGALRQISGAFATTLTGGITSSSAARINNDATTSITISTTQITNSNLITFGISTTGDINIPITINGAGGITKDGAGTGNLILSANNGSSYTGITTVSAGFLKVSNASALGSSVSGNTVVSGGTILIDSNNYTIAEPFNITGTGLSSNGAIRNLGKQTILSGAITLGGAATITSYGYNPFLNTVLDSLIITGGITLGSNALTLDVTRGMRIGDQNVAGSKITGTGAVIKSGGTDTLVMNVANDYSGITTVNNGVIVLKTATSLGTGVNGTTDHTSIAAGAAVKVDVSSATIQEYFSLNGTGINATGNIRVPSTSAGNTLSGTITIVTSGARINSDATLLTLSNATSIATGTNMSVALGGIGAITISGSLSGSGTITKDGTGAASILTLKGNSTGFTGPITVAANSNLLLVSPTLSSNTSVLGTTGIVTINSGSAMQIEGGVALVSKPITVFGTGINNDGVIRSLSGANEIAGAITVSSNARINVDAGSLKLSNASALALGAFTLNIGGVGDAWVSGVITGTGAITKDGGSSTTLTLSGASSSYSGPIAVGSSGTPAAGILKVITNGSASGTGALTVYSGSALHIGDGTAVTLSNNMTVYGTGIGGAGVIRNLLGSNILSGLTTFGATSRINSDAGTLTFSNGTKAIELVTYGVTFGGSGATTVGGILASTASSATATLDKDGSGTLTLSGANTYHGVTTISAGVVNIRHNTALGNSATNTLVVNGAALQVQGTLNGVAEPITLNGLGISGAGGALRNISDVNAFTGLITLGLATRINSDAGTLTFSNATKAIEISANTLNIGGASGDIVLSGPINGSGDITKDGGTATTLTISANNNSGSGIYSGNINIGTVGTPAAGILKVITNNNALGTTAGKTTIYSGSALNIGDGTAITVPENFDIYGTGITSGGAVRNISGTNTLTGKINLLAAARINSDAGNIIINNVTEAIAMNSVALNIGGTSSGSVTVSGVITGSGGGTLTKDGTSTNVLYLSGTNTYTGVTAISNGVINVTSANALGNVSGNTTIASLAALEIQGGITLAAEPISVSSTGTSSTTGGIRNISGVNIITGTVTSAAASRINNDAGTLTLNNSGADALVLNATTIIGGASDILITGKVSGASASNSITKDGNGTLSLSGNTNDYLGQTLVTAGIVKVNNANSLGNTTNASYNTVVSGTGTVQLDAPGVTLAEPFTISGTGYTSLGAIRNPSGANTLSGAITLGNTATIISASTGTDLLEISGNINTATFVFTINGTGNIKSSGTISGSGGITKLGTSTLTITGNNTSYSGPTIIGGATTNGGIVNIQNNNALGTVVAGQGTTVFNGSTLQFQGGLTGIAAEPTNIRGNGYGSIGAINNLSGLNVFAGPITLDSNARIVSSGTSTDSLRLTGNIALGLNQLVMEADEGINSTGVISSSLATASLANSLTKEGAAYLTLNGANTYIGSTTVTEGVLNLGAAGVIADSSSLIMNGGSLNTNFNEVLNRLYLTNTSSFNLGTSAHTITFVKADSLLNKKVLSINGWQGSYTTGVTTGGGKILLPNDTLFNYQLDQIRFIEAGTTTYYSGQLLGLNTNDLIPKPNGGSIASNNTNNSNITITNGGTSDGSWATSGTTETFTPNKDDANLLLSEVTTRLAAGKSVQIQTGRSGGTQSGTIIVNTSITTSSSASPANTLYLNGNSNVVVYKDIILSSTTANQVANIDFSSTLNDVIIQATLRTNGLSGATVSNGGNVTLTAAGRVRIYANGVIETKGGNNSTAAAGGNGGNVKLSGTSGVSIFGNINTNSGYKNNSSTDFLLSKPGSLTIYTENQSPGVFDGQLFGTMMVGNIYKKGRGRFDIKSSAWAWPTTGNNDILYKAADTVFAGTLKLLSGSALSDSANLVIMDTANATLDLNANTETIGSIAGGGTITGTGGGLTLTSVTTTASNTLAISTNFSGILSGNFALTKTVSGIATGVDTLVLSRDNSSTYTGVITVNYGILKVANANALGSSVTGNTVVNGGTILIDSGSFTITEPFNIAGTGLSSNGAIRNLGDRTVLAGAITLGNSATITSFGYNPFLNTTLDSLIISGDINTGASNYILTTQTDRGMRISSIISGTAGGLTKTGNDTLVLNNANTYAGATLINAGTVLISNKDALGSATAGTGSSSTTVGTSSVGATLRVIGIDGATPSLIVPEPLFLNLTGAVANEGAIRNTSGINYFTGAITVSTASTIVSTGSSAAGDSLIFKDGVMTLSNTLTVNTIRGARLGNNVTNQIISTGGITKTGLDTLVMQGNNTYTGLTTVSTGVISIRNANALGNTGNASQNTVVSDGAALYIVGTGFTIPEYITINGTGIGTNGVIWVPSSSGATILSGIITTNTGTASRINNDGAGLLTIGTAGFTNTGGITFGVNGIGGTTVTSVISGVGGLTKDGIGSGKLILSGANTYQGATLINTGVLQATSSDALGSQTLGSLGYSNTTITAGAALELNGAAAITVPEVIIMNGDGVSGSPGAIRQISNTVTSILSGAITANTGSISRINNVGTQLLTLQTGAFTNTGGVVFGTTTTGGITVNSVISGVGALTKDGTGTGRLILGGTNLYTGLTTISAGVVQLTNGDGLGSTSAGVGTSNTIVNDGAALEINGAITVPETLNLYGLGFVETTANGVIRMITGSNATISGPINILSASRINNTSTGVLTLQTGAFANTNGITFGITSTGGITVNSIISGAGTLTKDGTAAGRLVLGGVNTYQGLTSISQGFLQITSSDALGSQTAGTLGYSSTTISDGATLELNGTAAITVPEIINANGNGVTGTPGAIRQIHATNNATLNGTITALTGTATSINNDANALLTIGTGGITNTGGIIFRTTGTTGGINVTGVISGVGALTKDGALTGTGRLVLNAANTYQGITTVTNGVLQLKNNDALGSATAGTGTSYTIVSSPAAIEFNGASALSIPEDIRINGTGFSEASTVNGALRQISGAFATTLTGGVTTSSAARINSDGANLLLINTVGLTNTGLLTVGVNSTGDINISSVIAGAGGITKDGNGTLILNADNSAGYTGVTTVSTGILKVSNANALGSSAIGSNTIVTAGTVQVDGTGFTIPEPFTISGTGYTSLGAIRNLSGANIISGAISLTNSSSATIISTSTGADLFEISGAISTGTSATYILTFNGTGNIKSSGAISGLGGITKLGTSTLIITGNNASYTGATIIGGLTANGGIVNIQNNNALGATSAGTTVYNGSTLQFQGGLTGIAAEPTNIRGNGYGSIGAINNISGLNVFAGPITLDSNARIVSSGTSTDSLRLTGNIALVLNQLVMEADEGINSTGVISSSLATASLANSLTKEGAAYLTLNGANTYIGSTTVIEGVLNLGAAGVIADSSSLIMHGGSLNTNYNETIKKLFLTNSSTFNLGSNAHTITFVSLDSLLNNKQLTINGWQGSYTDTTDANTKLGGTSGKILFSKDTLLGYQLDQIQFINPANSQNYYSVQYKSNKFLVPLRTAYAGVDGLDNSTATGFSNVYISTSNSSGISSSGTGTVSDPIIYTPTSDNANIKISEIVTSLNAGLNVKVISSNTAGRQSGTIVVNGLLTAANTASTANTLSLYGRGNVVVYQKVTLANGTGKPVPNVDFNSDSSDVVIQAGLVLSAINQSAASPATAFNGGVVNLTAYEKVRVYSNGFIESKGANNTNTGAGGNGGRVNLIGRNGVSIFGNINTTNGYSGGNPATLNLSRPGTLTISNDNSGAFDGQFLGVVSVGNIIKQGTGIFSLTNSYWPGGSASTDIYNKSYDTVAAGTLLLNSGAALSDSATVVVNAGATLDLNGKAETIGMIAGAGLIKGTGGSLTLSGLATTGASIPIKTEFSGNLSGSFSLIKNGVDSLVLSGDDSTISTTPLVINPYTGAISLSNGVVKVSHLRALGTMAGNTTITSTGTLLIDSNNYTITEPFTISGVGVATNQGAIRNLGRITTLAGNITLGGSARIVSSGFNPNAYTILDSLIITGGINTGAAGTVTSGNYILTVDVGRGLRITGSISGTTGGLTKEGTDTLQLDNANTYAGATLINAGTVLISNKDALGSATLGANSSFTIIGVSGGTGATLRVIGSGVSTSTLPIPEYITLNGTGSITNEGAIRNTSGTNYFSGNITLGSASTIVSTGVYPNTDSLVFTDGAINTVNYMLQVNTNRGVRIGNNGVLINQVNGSGGINKFGTDTLVMSGNNSYTGVTNIVEGVIVIKQSNAFGNGSNAGYNTVVQNGAGITVIGIGLNIPEPITINGAGVNANGVIWIPNISGATTFSGIITTASASRINNDGASLLTLGTAGFTNTGGITFGVNGSGGITVTSAISGTSTSLSNLTKDGIGSGKLILGAINSYMGTTTINTGVIQITASDALGYTAGSLGTIISNGTALELNGSAAISFNENITVNGNGITGVPGAIRQISNTGAATMSGILTVATASRVNNDGTALFTAANLGLVNTGGITFGTTTTGGITVNNVISGAGDVTKDGAGTGRLIIGGANTYTGLTNINAGVLQLNNGNGLGSSPLNTGSSSTTILGGAALELAVTMVVPEDLYINGAGFVESSVANGVIRLINVNNVTLTGAITTQSASSINNATPQQLVFQTGAFTNNYDLTFVNTAIGNTTVKSAITGTGSITKDGIGTGRLILSGVNLYTGITTVSAGVLQVTSADALGSVSAGGAGASYTSVTSGASLELYNPAADSIRIPEAITINGNGVTESSIQIGAIRFHASSGNVVLNGVITAATASKIAHDGISIYSLAFSTGSIVNTGGITFAVNYNGSTGNINVNSIISGAGYVTKEGTGTGKLVLSNANIYTGITTVTAGILQITNNDALGSASAGGAGSSYTTVTNLASLELNGATALTVPEDIRINGLGVGSINGALRQISTAAATTLIGGLTSTTSSRLNNDATSLLTISTGGITNTNLLTVGVTSTGDVNISSVITGNGGITKDGTGNLILSSNNSTVYTGVTTVSQGTLKLNDANALGATSGNTVVNGGTVLLDSAGYTINEPFNIIGLGFNNLGTIRNLGKVSTLNGTITLAGSASIVSSGSNTTTSADSLLITAAVDLGATGNYILTTVVDRGMNISGVISGNTGGLTKMGLDTLLITGTAANTYKGATLLSYGKIRIKKAAAFGTADAGTTVDVGTTVLIDLNTFTVTEPFTINGNGVLTGGVNEGAIKTLYGINSITGTITLLGNSKINMGAAYRVSNSSDSLRLSAINTGTASGFELTLTANVGARVLGVISGKGSLIKEGLDTLLLSVVNTYAGATKLTAGCLRLGANYVLPSTATNSIIFNGGTFSSGGFTDTLGIMSITENSGIDIRYTPTHTLYFSEKANFAAGKTLMIYGWSGLVAETITKFGQSKGGDSVLVLKTLLKRSGETSTSKTNTMTKYGQEITAAIFTNYRGKLFFTAATPFVSTLLNTYELNRILFHNDFSGTDYAASQNASTRELVAGDAYVAPTETQIAPTISATTVTIASATTATVGGTISATGGVTINSSGVVWSTSPAPSVLLSTKSTNGGTVAGALVSSTASTLVAGTMYYARAYASYTIGTKTGTAYGPEQSFYIPNGTASFPGTSAAQLKLYGVNTDGWYYIKTSTMASAKQVYCNMTDDGGGWMLVSYHPQASTSNDGVYYPNTWNGGEGSLTYKMSVNTMDLWYNNGASQATSVMRMSNKSNAITPLLANITIASKIVYTNPSNLTLSVTNPLAIVNNTMMSGAWSNLKGLTEPTLAGTVYGPGDWLVTPTDYWQVHNYMGSTGTNGRQLAPLMGNSGLTRFSSGTSVIYGMQNVPSANYATDATWGTYAVFIK